MIEEEEDDDAASILCEPAQSQCTWTCHKRHFVGKFSGEKCRTCIPRPVFCASLRKRNAHGHVTRGILCGILQGKCRTLIPRPAFCASCAVETHMDMSQKAFCAEIQRENAGRFRYHLD